MSAELTRIVTTDAHASGWKPYPAYKDLGAGWLGMAPGNKATVVFQTVLTGSTGFVSSFYLVHMSRIKELQMKALRVTPLEGVSAQSVLYFNNNKPQMNADLLYQLIAKNAKQRLFFRLD